MQNHSLAKVDFVFILSTGALFSMSIVLVVLSLYEDYVSLVLCSNNSF